MSFQSALYNRWWQTNDALILTQRCHILLIAGSGISVMIIILHLGFMVGNGNFSTGKSDSSAWGDPS